MSLSRLALLPAIALAGLVGCEDPPPRGEPLDATTVEVRVPTDGFELEGVLHLPDRFEGEPVPGVVLMHGSGPQSRDVTAQGSFPGASFTVSIFVELAEALSSAGYAVLRYDKRSCSAANGLCENEYPTNLSVLVTDFLADAEAAVDWLGEHEAVDATRVVPVGHSQGASFGPHLLQDDASLPGAVMLAGAYRPADELIAWQLAWNEQLLREAGYTDAQVESALRSTVNLVEGAQAVRDGTAASQGMSQLLQDFWQSWFDVGDVVPDIVASLDRPVLAVSGDYDWQVPAEETEAWAALFAGLQGGPAHQAELLPCVTHVLNCVSEPNWLAVTEADVEENVSDALLAEVVAFLDSVTE